MQMPPPMRNLSHVSLPWSNDEFRMCRLCKNSHFQNPLISRYSPICICGAVDLNGSGDNILALLSSLPLTKCLSLTCESPFQVFFFNTHTLPFLYVPTTDKSRNFWTWFSISVVFLSAAAVGFFPHIQQPHFELIEIVNPEEEGD